VDKQTLQPADSNIAWIDEGPQVANIDWADEKPEVVAQGEATQNDFLHTALSDAFSGPVKDLINPVTLGAKVGGAIGKAITTPKPEAPSVIPELRAAKENVFDAAFSPVPKNEISPVTNEFTNKPVEPLSVWQLPITEQMDEYSKDAHIEYDIAMEKAAAEKSLDLFTQRMVKGVYGDKELANIAIGQKRLNTFINKAPMLAIAMVSPLTAAAFEVYDQAKSIVVSSVKSEKYSPFEQRMITELLPESTPDALQVAMGFGESMADIALVGGAVNLAKSGLLESAMKQVSSKLMAAGYDVRNMPPKAAIRTAAQGTSFESAAATWLKAKFAKFRLAPRKLTAPEDIKAYNKNVDVVAQDIQKKIQGIRPEVSGVIASHVAEARVSGTPNKPLEDAIQNPKKLQKAVQEYEKKTGAKLTAAENEDMTKIVPDYSLKTIGEMNYKDYATRDHEMMDKVYAAKKPLQDKHNALVKKLEKKGSDKKAIKAELNAIKEKKEKIESDFEAEYLKKTEELRGEIQKQVIDKGFKGSEEELSDIVDNVAMEMQHDQGYIAERNWDKKVNDIIKMNVESELSKRDPQLKKQVSELYKENLANRILPTEESVVGHNNLWQEQMQEQIENPERYGEIEQVSNEKGIKIGDRVRLLPSDDGIKVRGETPWIGTVISTHASGVGAISPEHYGGHVDYERVEKVTEAEAQAYWKEVREKNEKVRQAKAEEKPVEKKSGKNKVAKKTDEPMGPKLRIKETNLATGQEEVTEVPGTPAKGPTYKITTFDVIPTRNGIEAPIRSVEIVDSNGNAVKKVPVVDPQPGPVKGPPQIKSKTVKELEAELADVEKRKKVFKPRPGIDADNTEAYDTLISLIKEDITKARLAEDASLPKAKTSGILKDTGEVQNEQERTGAIQGGNEPNAVADGRGGAADGGRIPERAADGNGIERHRERLDKPVKEGHGNYQITEADEIGQGGIKSKYKNNLSAIKLLKQIESEKRPATLEEKTALVKYVGWGGMKQAFDAYNDDWAKEYKDVKSLLTPEEYEAARASVINAHYTSPELIKSMWQAVSSMGFHSGNVLEPSAGIGHFIGLAPQDGKRFSLVELDSITGRIATLLYPGSNVQVKGLQEAKLPSNYYDVIISNIPFSSYQPYDPRAKAQGIPGGLMLHDYFFAKALATVKPGGIVAFITSKGTMDKQDPKAREYMNKRARFLGAFRLPSDAFKKNANTEVVTDVIFLQKLKEGEAVTNPDFVSTEIFAKGEREAFVNKYFLDNPDQVLGNMLFDRGLYSQDEIVVKSNEDFEAKLKEAIDRLPKDIYTTEKKMKVIEQDEVAPEHSKVKENAYIVKDGKLFQKVDEKLVAQDIAAAEVKRVEGLIGIRDAVRDLIHAERVNAPDAEIESKRKVLNAVYDKFVKSHGALNEDKNIDAISDDPDAPLLSSLEDVKKSDKGRMTYNKRGIFKERQNMPHVKPKYAADINSALKISLGEYGELNWNYMKELLSTEIPEIQKQLLSKGLVFSDPNGDVITLKDEYLSGNVKQKLQDAEAAQQINPVYERNIEELRKVIPEHLTFDKIDIAIGVPWVKPKTYTQFLNSLSLSGNVVLNTATGVYAVEKGKYRTYWGGSVEEWGVSALSGEKLFERVLNGQPVKIFNKVKENDPATGKEIERKVLDEEQTALAEEKAELLKEKFKSWFWEDDNRRAEYEQSYNDEWNTTIDRKYDGEHLTFPGMNNKFLPKELRPSQKNAIYRGIISNRLMLAHSVGSGKTAAMIIMAMESKRLGLSNKSVITVPKATIPSWRNHINGLYPNANVLIANEKNFSKDKLKSFLARAATGNWDIIVLSHDNLEALPVSPEAWQSYLQEQIDDLRAAKDEAKNQGSRITVANIETSIKQLEANLAEQLDQSKKLDLLYFEELGVDAIYADESDAYKNLGYATVKQGIKGMGTAQPSKKAMDMHLKTNIMRARNGKIVFASGTPISNTIVEAYTMMKYLQPELLQEHGLKGLDAWLNNFAVATSGSEVDVTGSRYKPVTRFTNFLNLPILRSYIGQAWDIQTQQMLIASGVFKRGENLPIIKGGKAENVVCPMSPELQGYTQTLIERAEAIKKRKGKPQKGDDIMLVVMQDGIMGALDMRLVDPTLPANPNSKVETVIKNVLADYKDVSGIKGTQVIFIDKPAPDKTAAFNPQVYIKKQLSKAGIPENEIAFIHDAKNEEERNAIFEKMNNGDIRVLFGSTDGLGTGTNIQKRLYAMHHLSVPANYRPRDIIQREGRGDRPGNMNKEIKIYRYAQKGSLDTFIYQILESKSKAIEQFMRGDKGKIDFGEDIDPFEAMKALSSDNPMIKEKSDIDREVRKLEALQKAHLTERTKAKQALETVPRRIELWKGTIAGYENFKAAMPTKPTKETFKIKIGPREYTDKAEALAGLMAELGKIKTVATGPVEIGQYLGYPLFAEKIQQQGSIESDISIRISDKPSVYMSGRFSNDPVGTFASLDNSIFNSSDRQIAAYKEALKNDEQQIATANKILSSDFAKKAELEAKQKRRRELEVALRAEVKKVDLTKDQDKKAIAQAEDKKQVDNSNPKEKTLWHGSQVAFDKFDPSKILELGFHFGSKGQAESRMGGDGVVRPFKVTINNPYDIVSDLGDWSDMGMLEEYFGAANDGPLAKEFEQGLIKNPSDVVKYMKQKGYDGIKYQNSFEGDTQRKMGNNEQDAYIAFDSEQIKPDISNGPKMSPGFLNISLIPEAGKMINDKWFDIREYIEDDWLRVKKLIQKDGANVSETNNPYEAEIRYWGRVGARMEEADKLITNVDKDIVAAAKRLNVSDTVLAKEIDKFLIARHAPERNAAIGEKAAGMTDVEAADITADLMTRPYFRDIERIANEIQELNNKTLDTLLEGQVITQELYDTLRVRYAHHIPLNRVLGDNDDIAQVLVSRGFNVKGTGIKRAKGSELEISDILTNVVANYKSAIVRAEKNIVDNYTLRFVRENEYFDGLFEEIRPRAIGFQFDKETPLIENITDPTVLVLREKGKPVYLKINDPQLAMALRGVNRAKLDEIMRFVKMFTRLYSSLMTRFNPEFAMPNKIRDIQEVLVYLASKKEMGAKGALQTALKDPQSIKDITDYIRGKDTPGARLYKQMKMDGGTTGGMGLSTRDQLEIDLDNIRRINRNDPARIAQSLLKAVDNWNTIFEDSTRLSVYRQALAQGISREKAAVLAKEASLNFNKMGCGSPITNALWMFSNASIQGSAKMLRSMRNPKVFATVLTILAGAVYAVSEYNDKIDKDWRKRVSKWDRLNGFNVMIPTTKGIKYITIPISWGLKPIKVTLDYIDDMRSGEATNISDAASAIFASIIDAFNPTGGTDAVSALMPTILDLPSDIARNRSWSGGKIRPDWDVTAPASIEYFDSLKEKAAGKTFIDMARWAGDRGIEISPADMNYAFEQLIGGTGRFLSKTVNTAFGVAKGQPAVKEIPFVSRFYRSISQEEIKEYGADYTELQLLLKNQAKDKFYQHQQAELAYESLSKLSPKDMELKIRKIAVSNRPLADKIVDVINDKRNKLSYNDRLVKQLGVENGARAKYLYSKIQKLPTDNEKRAYIKTMTKKNIMSKNVLKQIKYLMKNKVNETDSNAMDKMFRRRHFRYNAQKTEGVVE